MRSTELGSGAAPSNALKPVTACIDLGPGWRSDRDIASIAFHAPAPGQRAEGQVRIVARSGDKLMFTVGHDGQTTWTERGVTPQAEAYAFWGNNFGFGITSQAQKPGFKAERVADGFSLGYTVHLVRLTDLQGDVTLFGIDP